MTDQVDPLRLVRDRIEDQSHSHWHEFSVIVASANILLALVLFGRIASTAHGNKLTFFAIAIALTSTLAAMLAYYSIQIGILFVVGPLRLVDVLVSFLLTAAQLALFLWPTHVLGNTSHGEEPTFEQLRQWLIFFGLFAFAGPFANWHAARTRIRRSPSLVVDEYELRQRKDRLAGFTTCALVMICWLLSFQWLTSAVTAGVAIAIVALTLATFSQERLARRLANAL
jgi:hypothetical protein